MFQEQNGRCKICNTHQIYLKTSLVVDHCHKTGHVRGLLCNACNLGIGLLKDKVEVLEKALIYIRKASSE